MTSEIVKLFAAKGVKFNGAYLSNVIHNKKRSTPHPLASAYICRGMWDRQKVDEWIKTSK